MSGALNQGFPNRVSGFLNPDGTLKDVWFRFFRALWERTGGGTAPGTIDDITGFVLMDDTMPEIAPDPAALLAWLISDTPDAVLQDFAYLMALAAIDEPSPPENDPAMIALLVSDA